MNPFGQPPGGDMMSQALGRVASLMEPNANPAWGQGAEGDSAHLGIVDPERAMRMTEQDIITCVVTARNASANARKPLEARWKYHEALYRLRTDDPEKEDWQAQIAVPELLNKVQVFLSMMQAALLDAPEWFRAVNEAEDMYDPIVRACQSWMKLVNEKSGIIEAILGMWEEGYLLGSGAMRCSVEEYVAQRPRMEMRPIYSDPRQAFEAAMMGMQTMQPQVVASPEMRNCFKWQHRSIWGIYPDPEATTFYEGKFVVETDQVYEEDVEEMVKAGVYDSIDDIGDPVSTKHLTGLDSWRMGIADTKSMTRRRHLRDNYTGNIYDKEGYIVAKNWVVTVLNERSIVRIGPVELWSGRQPFVWSTPRPYRNRVWGTSCLEADAKVQHELTDFINLALDDMKYAVLGVWRWDPSLASEPQMPESISPAGVYSGKTGVLERMTFTSNANLIWPVLNKIEEIGAKETYIGEWADGRPTSRGRPSAREVMTRTAAGSANMNTLGKSLERRDVERALSLQFEHIVQFGDDFSDPRLGKVLEVFGPGAAQILQDQRYRFQMLDVPFRFEVFGISTALDRESMISNVDQLLQRAVQMGVYPTDQLKLFYVYMSLLGLDPVHIGFPESPEAYQQQLWMAAQQAAQGGAAGPGAPSAQGTAAGAPSNTGQPPPGPQALTGMSQGQPGQQGMVA